MAEGLDVQSQAAPKGHFPSTASAPCTAEGLAVLLLTALKVRGPMASAGSTAADQPQIDFRLKKPKRCRR